jgi:GntR family transcriptional regulator, N-acetylglucosamine utilization regulator
MTPALKQKSIVWDIRLDKAAVEPVYLQIAAALRHLLRTGRVAPGAALPPEHALAKRFGVSRMTMRQANDVLEREGLIERQRGRGTFAVQNRLVKQEQETRSFSEEIRRRGGVPSSRLVSFKTIEAPAGVAADFGIAAGDPIYVIDRVRLADNVPMALESVQIPVVRCPNLERFNIVDHSLYQIFEENYGIELARSEEEISAVPPNRNHRKMLQLPAAAAVLLVKRKTYTTDGKLFELATDAYRGDLYVAIVQSTRARKLKSGLLQ